eukprot:403332039
MVIAPGMKFSNNDTIRLASTFHSMHAISSQITPNCQETKGTGFLSNSLLDGINEVITDTFRLLCFQSFTGIKFILISDPQQRDQDKCLQLIYDAYADFVSKNPFQESEMPIRSDLFDIAISKIFNQ